MEPLVPDGYFHIYNHSIGNELIFREEKNYSFFLDKYNEHIRPVADIMVYCLMPNHFHLVVRVKAREVVEKLIFKTPKRRREYSRYGDFPRRDEYIARYVSKRFANLFSSYTQSYNLVYNRRGSLFLKNFKRKAIEDDAYLVRLVNYIHRNPVNHGFVHQPKEWKYSSYNAIVSNKPTLVKRNEVLVWFGGIENFIYNHLQSIEL